MYHRCKKQFNLAIHRANDSQFLKNRAKINPTVVWSTKKLLAEQQLHPIRYRHSLAILKAVSAGGQNNTAIAGDLWLEEPLFFYCLALRLINKNVRECVQVRKCVRVSTSV